jgi:hypothetical protein
MSPSAAAAEDKPLDQLFDRMIPSLKRAMLRDSERRPEALSLEIVLLSSIVQLRKESAQP